MLVPPAVVCLCGCAQRTVYDPGLKGKQQEPENKQAGGEDCLGPKAQLLHLFKELSLRVTLSPFAAQIKIFTWGVFQHHSCKYNL